MGNSQVHFSQKGRVPYHTTPAPSLHHMTFHLDAIQLDLVPFLHIGQHRFVVQVFTRRTRWYNVTPVLRGEIVSPTKTCLSEDQVVGKARRRHPVWID